MIISQFLYFATFAILCFLIGRLMLGRKSLFYIAISDFLLKLLLGSVVLSAFISIYITGFKTLSIILLPLIGYIIYYNRKYGFEKKQQFSNSSLFAIFSHFIFWEVLSSLIIQGDLINGQKAITLDQVFYAVTSESLGIAETESVWASNYTGAFDLPQKPYHYFEMWLSFFCIKLFRINSLFALLGIVYPFYLLVFSLTIYSFFEDKIKSKYSYILVIFSLVFLFSRGLYHGQLMGDDVFDIILFDGSQKYIYPVAFAIFAIFLFDLKHKKLSITFLIISSIVSVVFLPSIIGGLGLYLFILMLIYKNDFFEYFRDKQFVISIIAFFILLAIYLFYLAESGTETGVVKSLGGIFYNSINSIIQLFKEQIIILFLFIILAFKKWIGGYKQLLLLVLSIGFAGIFMRALMDNNQNSFQIFTSGKYLLNYSLLLILVAIILKSYFKNQLIILLVLISISIIHFSFGYKHIKHDFSKKIYSFSQEYVNEISKQKTSNPLGIKIINAKGLNSLSKNPIFIGNSNYFPLLPNIRTTIILNVEDLLPDNELEFKKNIANEIKSSSTFLKITGYKVGSGNQNWDKAVIKYLNLQKPEFCIVSKGISLPHILKGFVLKEIVDSGSGERFYLLNTNKM
jgi:hypothetical protein